MSAAPSVVPSLASESAGSASTAAESTRPPPGVNLFVLRAPAPPGLPRGASMKVTSTNRPERSSS